VLLTAAVVASVASVAASGSQSRSLAGGTYRVGWDGLTFGDDQIGAYPDTFGLFTNLLVRTLVQYDHVAGAAGTTLVPDLAASVPQPTNGGRTYTFALKRGVRFGPPVNQEITSSDIRYAIERLARPKNGAIYPYYFDVIKGFGAYRAGRATSISGIVTPNARTITFDLARPTGDFLHRLTLPAAAPVPPEVGKCFEGRPGTYGLDLVSSGPYMIDGAKEVKIGSCGTIRPMRGISPTQLTLVRNPRYDPKTDSTAARESNPDRFVFVALHAGGARTLVQLVNKLSTGELEDAILYTTPKALARYAKAARARGLLRVDPTYWRWYISMNLTQPPFDDIHVRRAMSWLIDRAALRDASGGSLAGSIPEHVTPDELLDNRLKGFAPFRTPGDHGDLARAQAEMAKSKYATRRGVCIAKACKHVSLVPLTNCTCYAAGQRIAPIIRAEAAKIGIAVRINSRDFGKFLEPSTNIPITVNAEWMADYPDPADFVDRLFGRTSIVPEGNLNASLVGITPAQAHRLGVTGRVEGVPSVDTDLARCSSLTGADRIGCYAALDRKLTTRIVPWIPFLWRNRVNILGRQVSKWEFDQSTGETSFAHVAVK
jgi:peptide/nickel transport system substrate-binding protein